MTTAIKLRRFGRTLARSAALCLLALAATLAGAAEARAQWTTSGTNTTTPNTVGVGTTAPQTTLHVERNADADAGLFVLNAGTGVNSRSLFLLGEAATNAKYGYLAYFGANNQTRASNQALANSTVLTNTGVGGLRLFSYGGPNSAGGAITFNTAPAVAQGGNDAISERMRITSGGNIGIGTMSPQSLLDVSGASGMTLRNSGASTGFSFFDRPTVPGDQVVFQGNAGNYSLFNVSTRGANIGSERASAMAFWTVDIANTSNATQFQMQYTTAYGPVFFTQKFGTGAQGDKKISFQTAWQNTAATPTQLVLDTNGSVGIGTATPSAASKLHVAGNITVDGNINAKYQDVAEWVPSTQKLQAGTVVVLDKSATNHVLASSRAYDTKVAGVISAQPGIALGEGGEGKVLVATTGRVKIKADASRGAIEVGDLLVTSGVEGVAMKSVPVELGGVAIHRPGTIIGKALEPLAGGTGEILVLLSLQ